MTSECTEREHEVGSNVALVEFQEFCPDYLPQEVAVWAKLDETDPSITYRHEPRTLTYVNDKGENFMTIAKYIEEQL